MTYIFSKILTPVEIAKVFEKILKPLKFVRIDSKDIGIIVCIAISLIPIFAEEIQRIKYSLKSKGISPTFKNSLKTTNLLLLPLFVSLLHRINEIENSLKSKAYI
jgi:energy-coupling factor transporter transmembrane protein EcfT